MIGVKISPLTKNKCVVSYGDNFICTYKTEIIPMNDHSDADLKYHYRLYFRSINSRNYRLSSNKPEYVTLRNYCIVSMIRNRIHSIRG